jgi:hypothetical protein
MAVLFIDRLVSESKTNEIVPVFHYLDTPTPPKSCARCKSKYWREPRKRNSKLPVPVPNDANDGMLTVPRIKATRTNIKRLTAQMENLKKQIRIPIPVPNRKKKKI